MLVFLQVFVLLSIAVFFFSKHAITDGMKNNLQQR